MRGCLVAVVTVVAAVAAADEPARREVIPARRGGAAVSPERMRAIHAEVATPHKYGVVLVGEGGRMVDSPSVFRHGDRWYMAYLTFDGTGYETLLAESDDLLQWRPLGKILPFRADTWDARQAAGYVSLQDVRWGGSAELRRHDGRYWMSYLGGNLPGYEADPLMVGMAWTHDPARAEPWTRLPRPVLSREQPDCRDWEKLTQYKSNVIHDADRSLGHPFVMFYNAKTVSGREVIGMAVSDDMASWSRYGNDPVIDHGAGIAGDPQVVRIGDEWVMFYFRTASSPGAFDTFAASHDLVTWTTWDGPPLVEPSESWDGTYAHKPWLIKHDGVVYHFYDAVGDRGRVIALATSRDLRARR